MELNIEFIRGLVLVLVAAAICFIFRHENKKG